MTFEVVFSPESKRNLQDILDYCINRYQNVLAAYSIYEDFQKTALRLG